MDASYRLEMFISEHVVVEEVSFFCNISIWWFTVVVNFSQVLVELQFSFLCFLVAQNYDSFEQWKHLVALLCTCVKAMKKFPNLFISFMADLHFQVQFSFPAILFYFFFCRCRRSLKTSLLTLYLRTTSWYPACQTSSQMSGNMKTWLLS